MKKNSIFLIFALLLICGCTNNQIYRDDPINKKCFENNCASNVIEQHDSNGENYDLAFIEFSDRGNLFNREKYNEVIDYVSELKDSNNGVAVFVYVHGWKHNASNENNGDVSSFRKVLKIISEKNISKRKVMGIYIGWRGSSLSVPFVDTVTYWGRKSAAHQVGSGGLTEVLLRLERLVRPNSSDENQIKNSLAIIGHSFGSAAILTALKEIIIQKLININEITETTDHPFNAMCQSKYVKTSSFGDGIFLLNPAVEANEMLQIKELINQNKCYSIHQPKLLHILTSKNDIATSVLFYLGQELGVSIPKRQTQFIRKFRNYELNLTKEIKIFEEGFDGLTIGNAPHYRTHTIDKNLKDIPCAGDGACFGDDPKQEARFNIPVAPFEPISVVYVDPEIIQNHTDITNNNVASYIATSIVSNQDKKVDNLSNNENLSECYGNNSKLFTFAGCLNHYKSIFTNGFKREFPKQNN